MTGRELILYILQNNLENDILFKDGVFVGLISDEELAVKFGVGVATVRAWYWTGMIKGVKINDSLYFWRNVERPMYA